LGGKSGAHGKGAVGQVEPEIFQRFGGAYNGKFILRFDYDSSTFIRKRPFYLKFI
jgi:hypothetical protein